MTTVFRLKEVTYRYPSGHLAIDGIDLEITSGAKIGLAGPNGAGKSTLLRMLAGAINPSTGTMLHLCREWHDRGLVFQDPDQQLFCNTIREDLAFGPFNMGLPEREIERRITDVSNDLGIEPFLDRSPWEMSFGQKKLCAIASILTMQPEILLLDEPTAGLDSVAMDKIMGVLRRYQGTLLCVSHHLNTLTSLCHEIIILQKGRICRRLASKDVDKDDSGLPVPGTDHPINPDILKKIKEMQPASPSSSVTSLEQPSVIKIERLRVHYNGFKALKGIDFSIKKGEKVALVGENGAGKTTLLKTILGALPYRGRILIDGKDLSTFKKKWTGIGIVFQESSLQLLNPTVFDEVAFGPRQLGLAAHEIKIRVSKALKAMGLLGFEEKVPQNLSGGEKKRVVIASIISMEPDVFILDEPSAGLDAETEEYLTDFFRNTKAAVLVISHHLKEVREICNRVLVMDRGELCADLPMKTFMRLTHCRISSFDDDMINR